MRVACDLETSCGVKLCPGFGLSNSSKCEHAVHPKLNQINIIGVWDGSQYYNFGSDVKAFDQELKVRNWKIVFHSKNAFDFNTLRFKNSSVQPRDIVGNTYLLGACISDKISQKWLNSYNEKRTELNAKLPPKQRHRVGTQYSLKTMAPYYLGVEPFWENPASHDDPNYNRLDCQYTYSLDQKLMDHARQDQVLEFYERYLIPWSKLLAEAEYEGVLIDEKLLHKMYADACQDLVRQEEDIHADLGECFRAYRDRLVMEERRDSEERLEKYLAFRLKNPSKSQGVIDRYEASLAKKIEKLPEKFNLASSQQMLYICQYYGINTDVEKRDKETSEWISKEGTDKFVLKRAKVRQKLKIAETLLRYREKETEVSYLKQYINACVDGRIYCSFSIVGTRTGRLSSSGPNLQNVKGSLRHPFIIGDPNLYSIYTVDASQIEPRVIAYLTSDKDMVTLFQEGRSYHNYATPKFFPKEVAGVEEKDIKHKFPQLYKTAKIGDLSIIYGTGKRTFQTMCLVREEMDIAIGECDRMVKNFREGLAGVMEWKRGLEEQCKRGVKIYDRFGFLVQPRDQSSIFMTLFNTFVQGMASRMIFHASLMAQREFWKLGIDAKPLLWVHDEVVWRFPKGKELTCQRIVDKFMTCYQLETPHGRVPLGVEGNLASCWLK